MAHQKEESDQAEARLRVKLIRYLNAVILKQVQGVRDRYGSQNFGFDSSVFLIPGAHWVGARGKCYWKETTHRHTTSVRPWIQGWGPTPGMEKRANVGLRYCMFRGRKERVGPKYSEQLRTKYSEQGDQGWRSQAFKSGQGRTHRYTTLGEPTSKSSPQPHQDTRGAK